MRQQVGVYDQCLQLAADLFDGVIDKRLLAGKLFQRGFEIALAKLSNTGHRLLLDRNVTLHHFIDALGHRPVSVFEFLHWNDGVDVAGVVRPRHSRHLFGQAIERIDALIQIVLDGVEVAVIVIGDLGRDLALADFVHVVGREVQRPDHSV